MTTAYETPYGNTASRMSPSVHDDAERLESELRQLEAGLAELDGKAELVGHDLVRNLHTRVDSVRTEARILQAQLARAGSAYKGSDSHSFKETAGSFADVARERTRAARARTMQTAGKLRHGAQDVGQGFKRAWGELRQSFSSARGRLHDEE